MSENKAKWDDSFESSRQESEGSKSLSSCRRSAFWDDLSHDLQNPEFQREFIAHLEQSETAVDDAISPLERATLLYLMSEIKNATPGGDGMAVDAHTDRAVARADTQLRKIIGDE